MGDVPMAPSRQPARRRELLRAQRRQALLQSARHTAQAQVMAERLTSISNLHPLYAFPLVDPRKLTIDPE